MAKALIWTEPIERGDCKLGPEDIKESITWYKEQTGQLPTLLMLCPKNEKFSKEIPEDIEVIYRGGVLKGEVWLSTTREWVANHPQISKSEGFSEKSIAGDTSTILSTVNDKKFEVDKIKSRTLNVTLEQNIETRGRKKVELPDNKIQAMASIGMGSKKITAELKGMGFEVSYRTIQRRLQGKLL